MTGAEKEWIEWAGGECPVAWDTIVSVKLRDGTIEPICYACMYGTGPHADLSNWVWSADEQVHNDIIAYRVVQS